MVKKLPFLLVDLWYEIVYLYAFIAMSAYLE